MGCHGVAGTSTPLVLSFWHPGPSGGALVVSKLTMVDAQPMTVGGQAAAVHGPAVCKWQVNGQLVAVSIISGQWAPTWRGTIQNRPALGMHGTGIPLHFRVDRNNMQNAVGSIHRVWSCSPPHLPRANKHRQHCMAAVSCTLLRSTEPPVPIRHMISWPSVILHSYSYTPGYLERKSEAKISQHSNTSQAVRFAWVELPGGVTQPNIDIPANQQMLTRNASHSSQKSYSAHHSPHRQNRVAQPGLQPGPTSQLVGTDGSASIQSKSHTPAPALWLYANTSMMKVQRGIPCSSRYVRIAKLPSGAAQCNGVQPAQSG